MKARKQFGVMGGGRIRVDSTIRTDIIVSARILMGIDIIARISMGRDIEVITRTVGITAASAAAPTVAGDFIISRAKLAGFSLAGNVDNVDDARVAWMVSRASSFFISLPGKMHL